MTSGAWVLCFFGLFVVGRCICCFLNFADLCLVVCVDLGFVVGFALT